MSGPSNQHTRFSLKDTFYLDPSVEGCDNLAARAKQLGLKTKGFLNPDVTVCVAAAATAAATGGGGGRGGGGGGGGGKAAEEAAAGQSRGRRKGRIHRMVAQAQTEPRAGGLPQPQASIADRARQLRAVVVSRQGFLQWLEHQESRAAGGAASGKGKGGGARPMISRGKRAGGGADRFRSLDYPRVIMKDLDGLDPDRVQAFPPELLRKCSLHEDAPPGICPFTPREQWEREVLKLKKKDAQLQGGAEKAAARGPQKQRRGGWCECCEKQYIGTMSEHCATDQHHECVAADPSFSVLLALEGWTAADDDTTAASHGNTVTAAAAAATDGLRDDAAGEAVARAAAAPAAAAAAATHSQKTTAARVHAGAAPATAVAKGAGGVPAGSRTSRGKRPDAARPPGGARSGPVEGAALAQPPRRKRDDLSATRRPAGGGSSLRPDRSSGGGCGEATPVAKENELEPSSPSRPRRAEGAKGVGAARSPPRLRQIPGANAVESSGGAGVRGMEHSPKPSSSEQPRRGKWNDHKSGCAERGVQRDKETVAGEEMPAAEEAGAAAAPAAVSTSDSRNGRDALTAAVGTPREGPVISINQRMAAASASPLQTFSPSENRRARHLDDAATSSGRGAGKNWLASSPSSAAAAAACTFSPLSFQEEQGSSCSSAKQSRQLRKLAESPGFAASQGWSRSSSSRRCGRHTQSGGGDRGEHRNEGTSRSPPPAVPAVVAAAAAAAASSQSPSGDSASVFVQAQPRARAVSTNEMDTGAASASSTSPSGARPGTGKGSQARNNGGLSTPRGAELLPESAPMRTDAYLRNESLRRRRKSRELEMLADSPEFCGVSASCSTDGASRTRRRRREATGCSGGSRPAERLRTCDDLGRSVAGRRHSGDGRDGAPLSPTSAGSPVLGRKHPATAATSGIGGSGGEHSTPCEEGGGGGGEGRASKRWRRAASDSSPADKKGGIYRSCDDSAGTPSRAGKRTRERKEKGGEGKSSALTASAAFVAAATAATAEVTSESMRASPLRRGTAVPAAARPAGTGSPPPHPGAAASREGSGKRIKRSPARLRAGGDYGGPAVCSGLTGGGSSASRRPGGERALTPTAASRMGLEECPDGSGSEGEEDDGDDGDEPDSSPLALSGLREGMRTIPRRLGRKFDEDRASGHGGSATAGSLGCPDGRGPPAKRTRNHVAAVSSSCNRSGSGAWKPTRTRCQ